MGLFRRSGSPAVAESPLAELMSTGRDALDGGQLVRALARSVVHVPLPGVEPVEKPTLRGSADGEGPPLYVVEDDDGTHAFLYSTPSRLVEAFGEGVTAASMPFPTLLAHWPAGVDLVLDPGHPDALEVPLAVLEHVVLEVIGVPTGTAVQPGPRETSRVPSPELVQLIGATRTYAEGVPEIAALYRAESIPDGPNPRPVLDVVVELDEVPDDRLAEVMSGLSDVAQEVEPRPLRLQPVVGGEVRGSPELAERTRGVDEPYYVRSLANPR